VTPDFDVPRYDRPAEQTVVTCPVAPFPLADLEGRLTDSTLSPGSRDLVRALVRLARPRLFPGGGPGLDYAALFKTAARPDLLRHHIEEVAAHLQHERIDLLVVPGMSGYPIGAMYSQASGIPAILLKKQTVSEADPPPPPGAFVIPSYTGAGDTLISADMMAVADILAPIVRSQCAHRSAVTIRIAGADEIIDKATMATAITDTAPLFCRSAIEQICADDGLELDAITISVVAWVTPLIKLYNHAAAVLQDRFGITPFAGIGLTALYVDPPVIGFDGLGAIALDDPQ
jgi:hypothetical protein